MRVEERLRVEVDVAIRRRKASSDFAWIAAHRAEKIGQLVRASVSGHHAEAAPTAALSAPKKDRDWCRRCNAHLARPR